MQEHDTGDASGVYSISSMARSAHKMTLWYSMIAWRVQTEGRCQPKKVPMEVTMVSFRSGGRKS